MKRHMSVRMLLMLLCLGCLSLLLLVTVLSMQLIFPRYYRDRTVSGLEEAYRSISEEGITPAGKADLQIMARLERENLSILVFEPEHGQVLYNSRIDAQYIDQVIAWQSEVLQSALALLLAQVLPSVPASLSASALPSVQALLSAPALL